MGKRYVAIAVLELFLASLFPVFSATGARTAPAPKSSTAPSGAEGTQPDSAAAASEGKAASGSNPAPADVSSPQALPERRTASREVTPGSGGRLELDGVVLEIPAGAVEATTVVTITALPYTEMLSEDMVNVTAGAIGYRFGPHGMKFSRDVLVTMPFNKALLSSETALSGLFTYFYSESGRRWEKLRRVILDREAVTVTSATNHFTDMINATLSLPEGPNPLMFDVNSIKNLEAADPGDGVPMPQGLQPGPYGSASFSIDLRLPKGRGNATPALALSYSSELDNGWMGRGFDIETPAIFIDTRFGLPNYDRNDRYILDGEELACTDLGPMSTKTFRPLRETGFARIQWVRTATEDYWEVTDKSGDVRVFGQGNGWIGPDRTAAGGSRDKTFIWYLTGTRDPFGNTVSYDYEYDATNRYTYLSRISYSGREGGDAGAYEVRFLGEPRPDRRTDARGKFPAKLAQRLARVEVRYAGALMRSYVFTYGYSEFGQSRLSSYQERAADETPFYTYSFEYNDLASHEEGGVPVADAYDGFDPQLDWDITGGTAEALSGSSSSSGGGSLYAGLQIWIWIPFFGTEVLAEFGVRGGFDIGTSMSTLSFIDVNGDCLPDIAWKDGDYLRAILNQSGAFGTPFGLSGLTGKMDQQSETTVSVGGSVGLLGATAALTYQYSWQDCQTSFTDVNGDGFLDFVTTGSSQYAQNNKSGTALLNAPWTSGSSSAGSPISPEEDAKYKTVYYRQEPVRAWRAYRSGDVTIEHEAALVNAGSVSQDGVSLKTYRPGMTTPVYEHQLTGTEPSWSSSHAVYTLGKDDKLYFRMDTGDNETGDDVDWHVKIRYTSVRFFEDMANAAEMNPPLSVSGSLPDPRLAGIYAYDSANSVYNLLAGWQDFAPAIREPACAALIALGCFIPKRVPRADMDRIIAHCGTATVPISGNPLAANVLLSGYKYVKETETFFRCGEAGILAQSDAVMQAHLAPALSSQPGRLQALAYYTWLDGSSVVPHTGGGGESFMEDSVHSTASARILGSGADAVVGETVNGKGVLLDRSWTKDEPHQPVDSLWLRSDGSGGWETFVENAGGGETEIPCTSAAGTDELAITTHHHGAERVFTLSGSTSLITELPAAVYLGPLSAHILEGETFSTYSYERIPDASWHAIYDPLPQAGKDTLDACYIDAGAMHTLDPDATVGEIEQALPLLHTDNPTSIFDVLTPAAGEAKRFIMLTAGEYTSFTSGDPALDACFTRINTGPGAGYYRQLPDLTDDQRLTLHDAMEAFRRDVELFDYYTPDEDTGIYSLTAPSADWPTVEGIIAAAGISVWEEITRAIVYSSADSYPVDQGTLPDGQEEEEDAPHPPVASDPGADVGIVHIPVFDEVDGRTLLSERYLHVFDSGADYSPEDLVRVINHETGDEYPDGLNPYVACNGENEAFCGGEYGWYYGLWVGNRAWNDALIGQRPPDPASGEPTPPPYFFAMNPNTEDGKTAIVTDGRGTPGLAVPDTSWIGRISSYSEPIMDDSGVTSVQNYTFAAFISQGMMHPSRNGGDAYYRLPHGGASGAPGSLSFISGSKSDALDVNVGIGVGGTGAAFSTNFGQSWQYQDLIDLNGDLYPDKVSFDSSKAGSGSFTLSPGTGSGFGTDVTWTTPFSHLCYTNNDILCLGASLGSSSGSTDAKKNSKGKTTSSSTKQPNADAAVSIGFNGTLGSSDQEEGFYDVNGDGLPDHLRRVGNGNYEVALNTGDGFAAAENWGSGISTPSNLFDDFDALTTQPSGLAHMSTGSFGASLGLMADGAVVGAGISVGYTGTVGQTYSMLEDMNRDGLLDQVVKLKDEPYFRVRFNLGDCFSTTELHIYRPEWTGWSPENLRTTVEGDLNTIAGNLNGLSTPSPTPVFAGLPTSGNSFSEDMDPLRIDDVLEYTTGACFNIGGTITVRIPLTLVALTFTGGGNGSWASTSATVKFTDVNGDGLPDHVMKLPWEDHIRVKLNSMGKVGLLRTVHLPNGGRYDIEYERAGNTVRLPQSHWVMSRVTMTDGLTQTDRGSHSYATSYEYMDGYYDRPARLFLGFGEVRTTYADGSKLAVWYHNYTTASSPQDGTYDVGDRPRRAMERRRLLTDPASAPLRETLTQIVEDTLAVTSRGPIVFPEVTTETQIVYDSTGQSATSETHYDYENAYGNVIQVEERGDTTRTGDELYAWIAYDDNPAGYFKQHPVSIRVEDSAGTILRLREGEYGDHGELTRLTQYESLSAPRSWIIGYDGFGNMTSLQDPRGYTLSWEYDPDVHTYAVVSRSSNPVLGGSQYQSSSSWDYRWGLESAVTDIAGETTRFDYDEFGRRARVWSPYDTGTIPAVAYDYITPAGTMPWTVVTSNKVGYDPLDAQVIRTVTAIDGLGRMVQTAAQAEVRDGDIHREGWNLSGALAYDAKGRVVREGDPVFYEGHDPPADLAAMGSPTETTWDYQDRVLTVTYTDGAVIGTTYPIRDNRQVERTVDARGNISERVLNAASRVLEVRKLDALGTLLTDERYTYDAMGKVVSLADHEGHLTTAAYDMMGRRTRFESPDTGVVTYAYDESGNVSRKVDSVMRSRGQEIRYAYDGLNRLVQVDYPRSADVIYTYGEPGAADGGTGRLVRREDGTGWSTFTYGRLGETTSVQRTIYRLTPLAAEESALLQYQFDYLGRMQKITYPDGEVVSYGYDYGGQVTSITGDHRGELTHYVTDIGYDQYGDKVSIGYYNNVNTTFTYDGNRRWLNGIRTVGPGGNGAYIDVSYSFDLAGNVVGQVNNAKEYGVQAIYVYDALNQITHAEGTLTSRPHEYTEYVSHYSQDFAFDSIGNQTSKTSSIATAPLTSIGDDLNYVLDYSYYASKAHQPERIGQLWYLYDANGNMIEERQGGHSEQPIEELTLTKNGDVRIVNKGFGLARQESDDGQGVYQRTFQWDEENRLTKSVDGTHEVYYRYGADGQRAVKYSAANETLYFDPMYQLAAYPDMRESNHIYLGSTRIATRCNIKGQDDNTYEDQYTFIYHSDRSESAEVVTDPSGAVYEHIEYTTGGELWLEKTSEAVSKTPFRFSGKELDEETGLYYFGERYLNPRTGMWLSADPGLEGRLSIKTVSGQARKQLENDGSEGTFEVGRYHSRSDESLWYEQQDWDFEPIDHDKTNTKKNKKNPAQVTKDPEFEEMKVEVGDMGDIKTRPRSASVGAPQPESQAAKGGGTTGAPASTVAPSTAAGAAVTSARQPAAASASAAAPASAPRPQTGAPPAAASTPQGVQPPAAPAAAAQAASAQPRAPEITAPRPRAEGAMASGKSPASSVAARAAAGIASGAKGAGGRPLRPAAQQQAAAGAGAAAAAPHPTAAAQAPSQLKVIVDR